LYLLRIPGRREGVVYCNTYIKHIATGYELGGSELESWQVQEILSSTKPSISAVWPTQPHIQWVPWFFAGGRAARAEVNSERICTSAPPDGRDGVDKDDFS
jgi:hypothetical protein